MKLRSRLGMSSSVPRLIKVDEDLKLFKDLNHNQLDKHNFFDDFDRSAQFYRLSSSKKLGSSGFDFLAENEKHDYDWLKTPPATPLFPSIEMEANNGQQLFTQKELPILQPLTRFAGENQAVKNGSSKKSQLITKPKPSTTKVPQISSSSAKNSLKNNNNIITKPIEHIINSDHDHLVKISMTNPGSRGRAMSPLLRPKPTKTTKFNNNNIIITKPIEHIINSDHDHLVKISMTNPRSKGRAMSPVLRPKPIKLTTNFNNNNVFGFEFSNVTPPNLKTEKRSSSVSRGPRPTTGPRQHSCSPGTPISTIDVCFGNNNNNNNNNKVIGSKMVEKVMNARKCSTTDHNYLGSKKQFGNYN